MLKNLTGSSLQDAMDSSQANEIRPIFGISFCLQSPMFGGGGGGGGGGGEGGLWETGDLERLSLVDDEEPNPRKFFLMSVLCTRVRSLLLEARVVFLQAEIFNFNHMFQIENLSIMFPTVC
jgi:hypothetical protein